jgi:putative zinc finger/helix-turn-helix YgiT family protein
MSERQFSNGNNGSQALVEVCVNCQGKNLIVKSEEQRFLYGTERNQVELRAVVPVHECLSCGFSFTDGEAEDARQDAICRYLRVMTPREITALRHKYDMTRAEFGEISRIGTASLARWESGVLVQNAANDQLLYLLRFPENVSRLRERALLNGESGLICEDAKVAAGVNGQNQASPQNDEYRECRSRRGPMRARVRQMEGPEQCRAAAAGWSP